MKEKAIITQKQADAIEHFRKNGLSNSGILDSHFYKHYESETYKTISDENIDTDRLVAALYVGYEVEQPKFKTGDKVTWDGLNEVLVVKSVYQGGGTWCCSFEDAAGCATAKSFRYATPEEIYWLHELGRDKVPDFREGDVVATYEDDDLDIVVNVDCYMNGKVGIRNAEDWFEAGIIKGIYPAESFKPFKKEQTNEPK